MGHAILIWIARVTLLFLTAATLLPFLPVGSWWVRLCDFPRLQITMLLCVPVFVALVWGYLNSWSAEVFVLLGLSILLGLWQLGHVVPMTPFWPKELADASPQDSTMFRVLVANVQVENRQHEQVLQAIETMSPDLLLLVEMDSVWEEELKPLRKALPHDCGVTRDEGLGIALWSRWPLDACEVRHLVSERRATVFADVRLPDSRSIRFVGVHPLPPGLPADDGNSRRDSRVRDAELVLVAQEVAKHNDTSWIVTGDFNDVAWSRTTRLFKSLSGLRDVRVGRQLLNTYHAEQPLLRYPIDHLFCSPGFGVANLERVELPGSDHFGVLADISPPKSGNLDPTPSENDKEKANELIEAGQNDAEQQGEAASGK